MLHPIGVFDSGYGGLTILKEIRKAIPEADYIYLGDNARAPYGTRSFGLVYEFTRQAVSYLFGQGCPLVILACNTASAKALRSIQQRDLPAMDDPAKRVLGVIRPTVEAVETATKTGSIGIFGTPGPIASHSYEIEIGKRQPDVSVYTHACPMWVPLVEYGEAHGDGADYFVRKDVEALFSQASGIDTLILGCTHYPILLEKIRKYVPEDVTILSQGDIVAASLAEYLHRHPEMDERISRKGTIHYLTTENADKFSESASKFMGTKVEAVSVKLPG